MNRQFADSVMGPDTKAFLLVYACVDLFVKVRCWLQCDCLGKAEQSAATAQEVRDSAGSHVRLVLGGIWSLLLTE